MAFVIKRPLGILTILLVLGLGTGCDLSSKKSDTVYSYNLDEMERGIFNSSSHTMTLNEWYTQARQWEASTYDEWSQKEGKSFYKEEKLKKRFSGSDMVTEDTVIYCDFAFHWRGEKIGDITGSITLTDIFSPTPKVWIQSYKQGEWWRFTGKLNMSEVTDTQATINWSMPVYKLYFEPPVEHRFSLFVLPNGSKSDYGFEVPIPAVKTINNANTDVGNLGTVSIKGVAVSGTLNVTYNGNPVPYVEIYVIREAGSAIQMAQFSSPGPNTPWLVILNPVNYARDIKFQIFGYSKENPTGSDMLFDRYADLAAISVTNRDVSDIVLDLGNLE